MKRLLFLLLIASSAWTSIDDIPQAHQISTTKLHFLLQSNQRGKLLILNVGPRVLYAQAHLPGAVLIGPTSDPRGIENLKQRVKYESKKKQIIIYCGCCPWDKCPNVKPAYTTLRKLGFTNVKVLHIGNNFGTDWVDRDFPVERGQ
jgi:rhodanese-related sulfurtransferase